MTVEPLLSVASTLPPGFSRINAPPPSDALICPMMGVGSAVIVEVGDWVGLTVTGLGEGVRVGVREGMPITAVTGGSVDVGVMVETSASVEVDWGARTGSGVGRPACLCIQSSAPVESPSHAIMMMRVTPVNNMPPREVG